MTDEQEARIKDYVKKYAIKHHITEEEAKEHLMCQLASSYILGDKTKGGSLHERNDISR